MNTVEYDTPYLRLGDRYSLLPPPTNNSARNHVRRMRGSDVDIIYDPISQMICEVRENGEKGIFATGFHMHSDSTVDKPLKFRFSSGIVTIHNKGKIRAIGFTADLQIAWVQRDDSSVDFVFLGVADSPCASTFDAADEFGQIRPEQRQSCRCSRDGIILSCRWSGLRHVLFITDQGPELYLIGLRRHSVKFVKAFPLPTNWSIIHPPSQLVLFASGRTSSIFSAMLFQNNIVYQLGKFEVDFGYSQLKPRLYEKDVCLCSVYGRVSLLVLKFSREAPRVESVYVYEFAGPHTENSLQPPVLSHILRLDLPGFVCMHCCDSVIVVHHKDTQKSLLFDIMVKDDANSFQKTPRAHKVSLKGKIPKIHKPICCTSVSLSSDLEGKLLDVFKCFFGSSTKLKDALSLFSSQKWIFYPPDVAFEHEMGLITALDLHFGHLAEEGVIVGENFAQLSEMGSEAACSNNVARLIDFIANRSLLVHGAVSSFLNVLRQCILDKLLPVPKISSIFEKILDSIRQKTADRLYTLNPAQYLSPLLLTSSSSMSSPSNKPLIFSPTHHPLTLDHQTLMRDVFEPLRIHPRMDLQLLVRLMLDYFLAIKRKRINFDYLPELLVKLLADAGQFQKLLQLLQQRVIDDSRFLAFELISLSKNYPPLHQMALDMLARRSNHQQIAEVFIQEGRIIDALRCLPDHALDRTMCFKLLDASWKIGDRSLKFTVYQYLRHIKELNLLDGDFKKLIESD